MHNYVKRFQRGEFSPSKMGIAKKKKGPCFLVFLLLSCLRLCMHQQLPFLIFSHVFIVSDSKHLLFFPVRFGGNNLGVITLYLLHVIHRWDGCPFISLSFFLEPFK